MLAKCAFGGIIKMKKIILAFSLVALFTQAEARGLKRSGLANAYQNYNNNYGSQANYNAAPQAASTYTAPSLATAAALPSVCGGKTFNQPYICANAPGNTFSAVEQGHMVKYQMISVSSPTSCCAKQMVETAPPAVPLI